jgi:hypothetical protein
VYHFTGLKLQSKRVKVLGEQQLRFFGLKVGILQLSNSNISQRKALGFCREILLKFLDFSVVVGGNRTNSLKGLSTASLPRFHVTTNTDVFNGINISRSLYFSFIL